MNTSLWRACVLYLSLALNCLFCLHHLSDVRTTSVHTIPARRKLQSAPLPPYEIYNEIAKHRQKTGQYRPGFSVALRTREDFGRYLESLGGFHTGVELGVQAGVFAAHMLQTWPSCTKYYLVDLWAQQQNYIDLANVDNTQQEKFMNECKARLQPWEQKTVFIRNYTSVATAFVPDELDFVYVDARHDYCGAKEDIELYWPKLRRGGIMAGHDYLHAEEVKPGQDWSKCMDGTINQGAVMGAVNEFAMKHSLTVSVTWGEPHPWRSWMIRKVHNYAAGK